MLFLRAVCSTLKGSEIDAHHPLIFFLLSLLESDPVRCFGNARINPLQVLVNTYSRCMLNGLSPLPHPCHVNSKLLQKYSNGTSKRKGTMQNNFSFTDKQDERSAASEENGREQQGEEPWLPHETQLPAAVSLPPSSRRQPGRKQLTLISALVSPLSASTA